MSDAPSPVRIRIRNFQSIEDLEIEVRGFTCVTGKSNIGKSAVIRAISSSVLNEPAVGMVRKGASFASVEIQADAWGYTWEKGERGVNRYTIGGKVLDKVGQSQVEDVANMGFFPVKIGSRKINPWYASQFSPIFLLDESGPAVTDFISEVSKLQVLQDAIVLAARGRKRAMDDAKHKAEELARLREREAKVNGLDGLERVGVELEQQAASIEEYEAKVVSAEDLSSLLEACRRLLRALEPAAKARMPHISVDDQLVRLKGAHGWNSRLLGAAHRIMAIQGGPKMPVIEVPEPPASDHEELSKARRFAHVPGLVRRVRDLEAAAEADVPPSGQTEDAMGRLSSAVSIAARLTSASSAVRNLSARAEVPHPPDGAGPLRAAAELYARLEAARSSVSKLSKDSEKLAGEAAAVKAEIDAIPSCPTCGRVGDVHAHQARAGDPPA